MKERILQKISDATNAVGAKKVADICCGSSIMGSFGLDLNIIELGNTKKPAINGDAQSLPLKSGCVDAAVCFQGLHHVKESYSAIGEISRISRKAVIFFEPLDVFATRLAVSLGIAKRREGNDEVHRLDAEKTIEWLHSLGFKDVEMQRQWYFSPNERLDRLIDKKLPTAIIQQLMRLLNMLMPGLGNRALFIALR